MDEVKICSPNCYCKESGVCTCEESGICECKDCICSSSDCLLTCGCNTGKPCTCTETENGECKCKYCICPKVESKEEKCKCGHDVPVRIIIINCKCGDNSNKANQGNVYVVGENSKCKISDFFGSIDCPKFPCSGVSKQGGDDGKKENCCGSSEESKFPTDQKEESVKKCQCRKGGICSCGDGPKCKCKVCTCTP